VGVLLDDDREPVDLVTSATVGSKTSSSTSSSSNAVASSPTAWGVQGAPRAIPLPPHEPVVVAEVANGLLGLVANPASFLTWRGGSGRRWLDATASPRYVRTGGPIRA